MPKSCLNRRKGSDQRKRNTKIDPTEEIVKLKSELKNKEEVLKAAEAKLEKFKKNEEKLKDLKKKKGLKLKEKEDKLNEIEEKLKKLKEENLLLTEEIKDLKDQKETLLTPNPKIPKDEESYEHFFMNKNLFERLIRQVLTF